MHTAPHFFSNHTPTTEIYTLSLHDALPICSAAPIRSPHVPNGMRDLPEAEARAKPPFEHPPGRIGCFCLTSFQSEPRGRARFPPQRRAVAKRVPTPDERAMGSTAAGNTAPRYAIGSQLPPHVEISRDRGSRGG